jgi:hypothetical protein
MRRLAVILGLLWAAGCWSLAEENARWSLVVEIKMVAVPIERGLNLVPRLRKSEFYKEAAAEVDKLLATGEAEMLGWNVLRGLTDGHSGARFSSESSEEITTHDDDERDIPSSPMSLGPRLYPTRKLPWSLSDFLPPQPVAPEAFSKRSIGSVIELECHVHGPSKKMVLGMHASLVQLRATETAIGSSANHRTGHSTADDRYVTHNLQWSTLAINLDQHLLCGVFREGGPKPRLVLFLLHATATPTRPVP